MKQTIEIELDGDVYMTSLYSATKGFKLLTKLAKYLGKPITTLGVAGGLEANITPELIGSIFDSAQDVLDENQLDKLIKEILEGVIFIDSSTGKNRQLNFDVDFRGKYLTLFKLLAEILKFQYSDFLSELMRHANDLAPQEQSKSNKRIITKVKAS